MALSGWALSGWLVVRAAAGADASGEEWAERDRQVVAQLDALIALGWEDAEVEPSEPAEDGQWCRRVYLDVLGRIPTIEEVEAYRRRRGRGPEKRAQLVLQLLYDPKYEPEYIENWTTIWTNILIGRSGGNADDPLTSRAGLMAYLREALQSRRPYNRMVRELLSAEGDNEPGMPDFDGAVNFLAGKLQDRATLATADTARIFLGLQLQCAQCHNHPFNDWKQEQFWSLNAFFRQAVPLRRFGAERGRLRGVRLADQDFPGENRRYPTPGQAEVYFELRNGDLRAAYPRFVDGSAIDPSGYVAEVNRRDELAELVAASDQLPRALVNRLWAHFHGFGFTRPVDDMGPHNPPSHPRLLAYLADQFRSADFDLRRLTAWIAVSRSYSLDSVAGVDQEEDRPDLGQRPLFSHFYPRQMRAEELYRSLLVATQADQTESDLDLQQARRDEWLKQFVVAFGTDEGGETTTFDGTIPQTLMMFNGPLVRQATRSDANTFLGRVVRAGSETVVERLQELYLAAFARKPTRQELLLARRLMQAHKGQIAPALEDLWWAMLNSSEFLLNH